MTPAATCTCKRHPDNPCQALITQEDLLCDACREPAAYVRNGNVTFRVECFVLTVNDAVVGEHIAPPGCQALIDLTDGLP